MFKEVEVRWGVAVRAKDRNVLFSQRSIMTCLLRKLSIEKASKECGYFIAVTSLKSIGKGKIYAESGHIIFPVVFHCRTFMPFKGEILEGVVHHVYEHGALLRCGPIKCAYLSAQKMPNYHYVPGINPYFMNNELSRIENDVVIRFVVLDVRWIETRGAIKRDIGMLVSVDGDLLGPVSLSGSNELDM